MSVAKGCRATGTPVLPHCPRWTLEKTATHNTVPGVHIMRHSEPASRPGPLRGSTCGRVLTPTPRWRLSAPSREPGQTGHKLKAGQGLTAESAWGAVPGLLPARFPRPLAEPAVRISPQRALHGVCRHAWLGMDQGLGIVFPR